MDVYRLSAFFNNNFCNYTNFIGYVAGLTIISNCLTTYIRVVHCLGYNKYRLMIKCPPDLHFNGTATRLEYNNGFLIKNETPNMQLIIGAEA